MTQEVFVPQPGDVIENCGYRPLYVLTSSLEEDLVVGVSLFDGAQNVCSIRHCGIKLLTPSEVVDMRRRRML